MCGIAGFVESPVSVPMNREDSITLIERMCHVIRHRGPDDCGALVQAGVSLGMRRLSIIDLASGHQPLANEDRSVWTVFNGEIYNFRELRRELELLGHGFATASDTEVIVHAYEQWGTEAISRLRGMFGLAIWDGRTRTLVLARDRMGIKPLHYAESGGRLYFASEIKSLLCAPDVPRTLDWDALNHYLSFLYTPQERSIFLGVRKLPPGHLLVWRNGAASLQRYWRLPDNETYTGTVEEAAERLQTTLVNAIRAHLVSDVPVGAFLSGGLDSSLVVALMARVSARVKTFSVGFHEPAFDELPHARRVAHLCGTDHHEHVVTPDGVDILDELIEHFDEPFADASAIPTWYVSKVASRHVKVVLSGDGGDELFGGYDRYAPHPRVAAFDRMTPRVGRRVASLAARCLPEHARGKNFLRHVSKTDRDRYVDSVRYFSADEKRYLLTPDVAVQFGGRNPEEHLAQHFDRYSQLPWDTQMMRFDSETYLPEDVLAKIDRMSMAHSLESRVPLLDNEVVALAGSLPASLKIRNGRRKHILKEVAAAWLPRDIVDRPKQGFALPLSLWFRGRLQELFADTLESPVSQQRGYFQPRFVSRLLKEHRSGRHDHGLRLWQLVVFERWHEKYIDEAAAPVSVRRAASLAG
jgi:asparagine synthase (glutamine-hydrolysing)